MPKKHSPLKKTKKTKKTEKLQSNGSQVDWLAQYGTEKQLAVKIQGLGNQHNRLLEELNLDPNNNEKDLMHRIEELSRKIAELRNAQMAIQYRNENYKLRAKNAFLQGKLNVASNLPIKNDKFEKLKQSEAALRKKVAKLQEALKRQEQEHIAESEKLLQEYEAELDKRDAKLEKKQNIVNSIQSTPTLSSHTITQTYLPFYQENFNSKRPPLQLKARIKPIEPLVNNMTNTSGSPLTPLQLQPHVTSSDSSGFVDLLNPMDRLKPRV